MNSDPEVANKAVVPQVFGVQSAESSDEAPQHCLNTLSKQVHIQPKKKSSGFIRQENMVSHKHAVQNKLQSQDQRSKSIQFIQKQNDPIRNFFDASGRIEIIKKKLRNRMRRMSNEADAKPKLVTQVSVTHPMKSQAETHSVATDQTLLRV